MSPRISLDQFDPAAFDVPVPLQEVWNRLFNHCETLTAENEQLRKELAAVRRRLAKYEKQSSRPKIKPNRADDGGKDEDKDPHRDRGRSSAPKPDRPPRAERIEIDREVEIRLTGDERPNDFVSAGFRDVVVQNILLETDNVRYRLERGYSASSGAFHEASLPAGVTPGYGAELEAFVLTQYFQLRVPQPKIHQLLTSHGIVISTGQISALITGKHVELLERERADVLWAGLCGTTFQQIDDTGMRVDGVNHYVTTVCSPYYSCFFTRRHKNAATIEQLLNDEMDDPNATLRKYVWILIGDDAGQFHDQTDSRGLCWIHEERHYRKLKPYFKKHQQMVEDVRGEIWDYYDELKAYKERPTKKEKKRLSKRFDELFGKRTGYAELDHRLGLTLAKKDHLLLVLQHPEIPLENNESERTLREWVIKRRISGGTRSTAGTRAWDVTLSLCDTARKVGQNFYQYLVDRLSGRCRLPSLADQIFDKAGVDNPADAAA